MAIYSLKNQKQFDLVNKKGVKLHSPYFIIVYAKDFFAIQNPDPNPTFLGLKVGRKFSKKAVIRNKAKRISRHLIRDLVNNCKCNTNNAAFIIIPKHHFLLTTFAKLAYSLQKTIFHQVTIAKMK
jgi:ribonuclease P protein component